MENESCDSYSGEDVEKLRLKFRKEALKACTDAEARGYENGIESQMSKLKYAESEAAKWKGIAEACSFPMSGKSKPTSMIKFVMEQVYGEMREHLKELTTTSGKNMGVDKADVLWSAEDTMNIVKVALRTTTERLLHKMPKVVLLDDAVVPPSHTENKNVCREDDVNAPSMKIHSKRPANIVVLPAAAPPTLEFNIRVSGSRIIETSKIFSSSTYAVYNISFDISETIKGKSKSLLPYFGSAEHRYSAFESLYSVLRKEYPHEIFPPIPPTGTGTSTASRAIMEKGVLIRRRQFNLWLAYISLHNNLQLSPAFIRFVAPSTDAEMVLKAIIEAKARMAHLRSQNNGSIKNDSISSVLLNIGENLTVNSSNSIGNVVYEGAHPHRAVEQNANFAAKTTKKIDKIKNKVGASAGPSGEEVVEPAHHKYSDFVRNISLRQIHSAMRDVDQLEPNFVAAIECSHYWQHVAEKRRVALQKFADTVPGIIEVESCNSTVSHLPGGVVVTEAKLWTEVAEAVSESVESIGEVVRAIETDFFEPHTYFGSTCFDQAKSKLNYINGISSGSDEHIDASLKAVQEWNIYRNIRHKVMLKYFESAATTMMHESQKQLETWTKVHSNIAATFAGDTRTTKTKFSFPTCGECSNAVKDEILFFENRVNRLRNEFAAAKSKSGIGETLKVPVEVHHSLQRGDERSHQTQPNPVLTAAIYPQDDEPLPMKENGILSRPVIRSGVRQRPTIVQYINDQNLPENGRESITGNGTAADCIIDVKGESKYQYEDNYFECPAHQKMQKNQGSGVFVGNDAGKSSYQQTNPSGRNPAPRGIAKVRASSAVYEETPGEDSCPHPVHSRAGNAKPRSSVNAQDGGCTEPELVKSNTHSTTRRIRPPNKGVGSISSSASSVRSDVFADINAGPATTVGTTGLNATPSKGKKKVSYQWEAVAEAQHTTTQHGLSNKEASVPVVNTANVPEDKQPLPEGWEEVRPADGGQVYYYNKVTRISSWEAPLKEQHLGAGIGVSAAAHKDNDQDDENGYLAQASAAVSKWLHPNGVGVTKGASSSSTAPFFMLLNTLPALVPVLLNEELGNSNIFTLSNESTFSELKKAYMKIARFLHPDKLSSNLDRYTKEVATEAFIILSQHYEQLKS